MSLGRLITRARLTVLGLNSGTSADGLDLAVVRVGGGHEHIRMLAGRSHRFPGRLREMILQAADIPAMPLEQLARLDNYLGKFMGENAAQFINTLTERRIKIDLIGSHGQTVHHAPQPVRFGRHKIRATLQIGSPDQIAAATGCVTIGDFRQADIAAGGEGAPITTGAMHHLFAHPHQSRLIVNIGGMANYFYFPAARLHRPIAARDCGPGNSLTDSLMTRLYNRPFDRNGRIALTGKPDPHLLRMLTDKLGFNRKTISTGRELFGASLTDEMIRQGTRRKLSPENLIATAAELTVLGIIRHVRPFLSADPHLTALYLMGGGRHNRYFHNRLTDLLPKCQIQPIDNLGFDGDLIEAAAYAVMAAACLRSEPLPTTRTSGPQPISGHIMQPPRV